MDSFQNPTTGKPKALGGLYTVRLTVEGMKHQIEQCILDHDGTLRATVEHEINQVVSRFNFEEAIQREAQQALRSVIVQCIEKSIREAFLDPNISEKLSDMISDHLKKLFNRRG